VPALTAAILRKQLAAHQTDPLYVLVGADDLEKSAVASEFADMVEEDLRAFNVERMYGAETKVDALIDAARTLPMMAPRRVIVVAEAEKLLVPKRESKAAEEEQERLEAFIQSPPTHATIVFVCGPLDLRRRVIKLLLKTAHVVDCGTIDSEADAQRWVKARATREKVTIDPAAVAELVARAGLDIVRLRAGFDRLTLYAMGQTSITADDVRQAVSAGPEAQADWGIANAIQRNDVREALRELGLAFDSGDVAVKILGQIRIAAEKLPAARLRPAMNALFRTDIALKSSGGDARILLERLIVEMCESGRLKAAPTYSGRGGRP
jgi:DNA polymerase III subunit delta